ncbi:MAG TPA: methionyl-tRNA formyltransferase, partial [Gemmatimonadaceae bacterium]|nr:methionyl-tRNA formyltransferase [Gemmatimonadaceae bacterium]
MRVVFWGTPEFAAPALRALSGEGFEVVGVVTQPDKPQGRSREIIPSPVKQVALDEDIEVLQPKNARDPDLFAKLSALEADVSVVVAYGHILPQKIIDLPRLGTLNIHASLLPALRGAAPIQAAIRLGHTVSGVTVMRVVQALDAGPMILQAEAPIL